jgi:hypothetical protein
MDLVSELRGIRDSLANTRQQAQTKHQVRVGTDRSMRRYMHVAIVTMRIMRARRNERKQQSRGGPCCPVTTRSSKPAG